MLTSFVWLLPFQEWRKSTKSAQDEVGLEQWYQETAASITPINKSIEASEVDFGKPVEKFTFDPNDATLGEFERLGFKPYVSERIIKYRETGAVYYSMEQLRSIYGVDQELLTSLENFISFPEKPVKKSKTYEPEPIPELTRTDFNHASQEDLRQIYGIGEVLSKRIIGYRNLLGGFVNFDQLQEVFHFPDSLIPEIEDRFVLDPGSIRKIDVNKIDQETLNKHPYIEYHVATAIINYRNAHGTFQNQDDLRKIHIISDSLMARIRPYLLVEVEDE